MQVIYWGAALLVVVIGALWKAAGMRGDQTQKWSQRVDIAEAGLDEGATRVLRTLRRRIDDLLGKSGEPFNPQSALADPADLLKAVRQFERLLNARRRVRGHFRCVLALSNVLVVCLLLLAVGIASGAVYLSGLVDLSPWAWAIWLIYALLALGLSGGLASFFIYWHLQNQLSRAESLSQTERGDD